MAGRKQTAGMELAIGATIIAGIILLIVMLMAWGNSTSFLSRHYRVVVNMVNVGGLKEGAPVKMGGFQIGRVASIQIRTGGTDMEIVLDIDEDRLLPQGSTAKVSTAGLVGDAFMEIIPGTSSATIRRAATVAEAERLESSPLPDLSEILTKVNLFGDQLTILVNNLNDIVGDYEFRNDVKSLAANMDDVALQASQILNRSKLVVDNVDLAVQNVVSLTNVLKDRVDEVTLEVKRITGNVNDLTVKANQTLADISDRAMDISDKTGTALENLNDGITDIRRGVNATIGDKEVTDNLAASIKNLNTVTATLAKRSPEIDSLLANLNTLSTDITGVSGWAKETTSGIEPASVAATFVALSGTINTASSAIATLTEVVEQIKREPVLALSINKAADRIVKMKFDEMLKQPQYRSVDAVLVEVNRWFKENMNRGYMYDPAFSYQERPYTISP